MKLSIPGIGMAKTIFHDFFDLFTTIANMGLRFLNYFLALNILTTLQGTPTCIRQSFWCHIWLKRATVL